MRLIDAKSWVTLRSLIERERDRAKNSIGPDQSLHVVKIIEAAALDQALGLMQTVQSQNRGILDEVEILELNAKGLVEDIYGVFGKSGPISYEFRSLVGAAITGDKDRFIYHADHVAWFIGSRPEAHFGETSINNYIDTCRDFLKRAISLNEEAGQTVFG